MSTHTESPAVRPLCEKELAEVGGGIAPLILAFGLGAMAGVVAGGVMGRQRSISMGELFSQYGY